MMYHKQNKSISWYVGWLILYQWFKRVFSNSSLFLFFFISLSFSVSLLLLSLLLQYFSFFLAPMEEIFVHARQNCLHHWTEKLHTKFVIIVRTACRKWFFQRRTQLFALPWTKSFTLRRTKLFALANTKYSHHVTYKCLYQLQTKLSYSNMVQNTWMIWFKQLLVRIWVMNILDLKTYKAITRYK